MTDKKQTEWTKRHNWAQCREPYKTELDTLGSHWIEDALTNEQLAFEVLKTLSDVRWAGDPGGAAQKIPVDDVVGQLKILSEAMLTAAMDPKATAEDRRRILDTTREQYGPGGELAR